MTDWTFSFVETRRLSGITQAEWKYLVSTGLINTRRRIDWNTLIACTIHVQLLQLYSRKECRDMFAQMPILVSGMNRNLGKQDLLLFSAFDDFALEHHYLDSFDEWEQNKWIIRLLARDNCAERKTCDNLGASRLVDGMVQVQHPRHRVLICCYVRGIIELLNLQGYFATRKISLLT